ncbi:MAG: hypothetical protein Q9212_002806 [Teloschistes hypoglaucus]
MSRAPNSKRAELEAEAGFFSERVKQIEGHAREMLAPVNFPEPDNVRGLGLGHDIRNIVFSTTLANVHQNPVVWLDLTRISTCPLPDLQAFINQLKHHHLWLSTLLCVGESPLAHQNAASAVPSVSSLLGPVAAGVTVQPQAVRVPPPSEGMASRRIVRNRLKAIKLYQTSEGTPATLKRFPTSFHAETAVRREPSVIPPIPELPAQRSAEEKDAEESRPSKVSNILLNPE